MINSGIISGAVICDGTGAEPFRADLLFENGIISGTGSNFPKDLPVFRGENLVLAPGFIDVHAHSDLSLAAAPDAFGKISQGVTTEVSGNCGLSPFPVLNDEVRSHLQKIYQKYNFPVTWNDFSGYISAVEAEKPAINFASFCGYNTLRANFTGYQNTPFSGKKMEEMRRLLSEMLDQGAVGLSTGLLYVPGRFADAEELEFIVSVLKGTGKTIAMHLRSEGDNLIESVEEAIRIAKAADNKLQISHLKTALPRNWNKIDLLLNTIREAQNSGCTIHADRYPYTFAQTSLSVILPPPWDNMSDAAIMEDLNQNPEKQEILIQELRKNAPDWERIILCTTAQKEAAAYSGEPFLNICKALRKKPEELCTELMTADAPGTMAAFGGLSGENLKRILSETYVCCGSDETARPEDKSLGISHPRGFGSFPKFFQFVKENAGLGEAIRRMTSLPAEICNFSDRGILKPGYAADMVLFDPEHFRDRATFKNPHTKADGIHSVFVNGVLSFSNGQVIQRAGKGLKIKRCVHKDTERTHER